MKTTTKIPCGVTIKFDNAMFLEILNRYAISGWNSWIEAISEQNLIYPSYNITINPPSIQVEFILSGIDLSNRDLDGIDLTLVYVSKGNFRDSSLYGAKILIANGCNFIGCDLRTASLQGCDISSANFTDAMLNGINWHRAFYYIGQPPIGLPADIMAGLIQDKPVEGDADSDTNKIVCLADVKDASYWVS